MDVVGSLLCAVWFVSSDGERKREASEGYAPFAVALASSDDLV